MTKLWEVERAKLGERATQLEDDAKVAAKATAVAEAKAAEALAAQVAATEAKAAVEEARRRAAHVTTAEDETTEEAKMRKIRKRGSVMVCEPLRLTPYNPIPSNHTCLI